MNSKQKKQNKIKKSWKLKEKSVFPGELKKLLHNTFVKDRYLWRLIKITLVVKLLILLIVVFSYRLLPFCERCYKENFTYPKNEKITWITSFKTWDAQHYLYLAEEGYKPEQTSNGFFPLFPLVIRLFNPLFSNYLITGLVVANICSFAAVILFYLYIKDLFNSKVAYISSLFLLAFPTSFYLHLIYSEALFLLLVFSFFYLLRRNKIKKVFLVSLLLPLSRAQGLLMPFVLLFSQIYSFIFDRKKYKFYLNNLIVFSGFLIGVGIYLLFMKLSTKSFVATFDSYGSFMGEFSVIKLFNVWDFLLRNFVFTKFSLHGFTTSMIDRFFFLFYLYFLVLIYKLKDKKLFFYSLIMGMVPALGDNFMSYSRYLLIIFPIYIVLALKFKKEYLLIVVLMFGLQLIFLIMHSLNYWVA